MNLDQTAWHIDETDFPHDKSLDEQLNFLLHFAILAPSSHNTQPWRFCVEHHTIDLFLDDAAWLRCADPDKRELYISAGCALENLLIAAEHFRLAHSVTLMPDPVDSSLAAVVKFEERDSLSDVGAVLPSPFRPPELFKSITVRHTNHQTYDARPLPPALLNKFSELCIESELSIFISDDHQIKKRVDELVVKGDAILFASQEYRDELGQWIGRGVFGSSWLMAKLGKLAVTHLNITESKTRRDEAALMSSPVFAVLCSLSDDRRSQIKVGQAYERICLLAAAHEIWTQPISQIVEVPGLRQELANVVPILNGVPQHPFRMGYAAAEKHHTPRLPMDAVLKKKLVESR